MTDAPAEFRVARPPRRTWPYLLGALVVVAGGVYGGIKVHDHLVSCGSGVKETGPRGECIGVSDSYPFEKSLSSVMEKIRQENQRVAGSGKPWVSVAYVEPFGDEKNPGGGKYGIHEELEGAYIAQRQLNHPQLGGHGDRPQIQLLVGNIGLRAEQWKPLTDQLIAMTHDDHPLVAVAGFGQSYEGTEKAVDALRAAKVPMMGATVTADNLASADEVGFFRISAPNTDQASAAVNYLKGRQQRQRDYKVMVIRDRNETDIYNTSMYRDFKAAATRRQLRVSETELQYVSDTDGITNAFSSVAEGICVNKPDAVYFAGRGLDLRGFITAMSAPDRRCDVTVLTGDDAPGVYYHVSASDPASKQLAGNWQDSHVSVLYTGLGHPDLSQQLDPGADSPYAGFRDLYHAEFGGRGDLPFQDGQAILAHDSVWTLGIAIRSASGSSGSTVNPESTLNALVSRAAVEGAGGPIVLGSDGNPENKPMALEELRPDGRYIFKEVIKP